MKHGTFPLKWKCINYLMKMNMHEYKELRAAAGIRAVRLWEGVSDERI